MKITCVCIFEDFELNICEGNLKYLYVWTNKGNIKHLRILAWASPPPPLRLEVPTLLCSDCVRPRCRTSRQVSAWAYFVVSCSGSRAPSASHSIRKLTLWFYLNGRVTTGYLASPNQCMFSPIPPSTHFSDCS